MKKDVLKLLSFTLCFMIFLAAVPISFAAADEPDMEIGISIKLDKEEYVPGDTITASLLLTGAEDEVASGYKLETFQAYVSFDADILEFVDGNYKYDTDYEYNIVKTTSKKDNNEVVALYFYLPGGINNMSFIDGSATIADIKFTVKAGINTGTEIKLDFDNTYNLIYGTPNAEKFIDMTPSAGIAKVTNKVIYGSPQKNGSQIIDNVTVTASEDIEIESGAKLIATLYETGGNMLLDMQIKTVTYGVSMPINFNIQPNIENYEVRYFLWNASMTKPIAQNEILVVGQQGE